MTIIAKAVPIRHPVDAALNSSSDCLFFRILSNLKKNRIITGYSSAIYFKKNALQKKTYHRMCMYKQITHDMTEMSFTQPSIALSLIHTTSVSIFLAYVE